MSTLRKLSSQAKRLLSNGTPSRDSQLSDKYIQEEIRQIAQKMLKIEYFNTLNQGDRDVAPVCIATYENLSVQTDSRGRDYVLLPAQPMNLPGGVGIQEVKPRTGTPLLDRAMIPILPHEFEMFRTLLVGAEIMKDQWCFEPARDRVMFTEMNEKTLTEAKITKVDMKLCVIDPATIDEDDNFPVPPEMEMDILKEVLVLHGYQPAMAHDMINNGNPNK